MSRGLYDKVNKVLIPTAGSEIPNVDSELSTTSTNPVQNKVVTAALNTKANASDVNTQIQTLANQVDENTADITTLTNQKADKTDLTSISETGTTASQAIADGTYFYLDGTLVKAIATIAEGATFTYNTNYKVVTAGALNAMGMKYLGQVTGSSNVLTIPVDADYIMYAVHNGYVQYRWNGIMKAKQNMFGHHVGICANNQVYTNQGATVFQSYSNGSNIIYIQQAIKDGADTRAEAQLAVWYK